MRLSWVLHTGSQTPVVMVLARLPSPLEAGPGTCCPSSLPWLKEAAFISSLVESGPSLLTGCQLQATHSSLPLTNSRGHSQRGRLLLQGQQESRSHLHS